MTVEAQLHQSHSPVNLLTYFCSIQPFLPSVDLQRILKIVQIRKGICTRFTKNMFFNIVGNDGNDYCRLLNILKFNGFPDNGIEVHSQNLKNYPSPQIQKKNVIPHPKRSVPLFNSDPAWHSVNWGL